jgi:uncharacterized membrane protein
MEKQLALAIVVAIVVFAVAYANTALRGQNQSARAPRRR